MFGVLKFASYQNTCFFPHRDRFRTFTNVMGDSLGAGIVYHLSKHELPPLPLEGGGHHDDAPEVVTEVVPGPRKGPNGAEEGTDEAAV